MFVDTKIKLLKTGIHKICDLTQNCVVKNVKPEPEPKLKK